MPSLALEEPKKRSSQASGGGRRKTATKEKNSYEGGRRTAGIEKRRAHPKLVREFWVKNKSSHHWLLYSFDFSSGVPQTEVSFGKKKALLGSK